MGALSSCASSGSGQSAAAVPARRARAERRVGMGACRKMEFASIVFRWRRIAHRGFPGSRSPRGRAVRASTTPGPPRPARPRPASGSRIPPPRRRPCWRTAPRFQADLAAGVGAAESASPMNEKAWLPARAARASSWKVDAIGAGAEAGDHVRRASVCPVSARWLKSNRSCPPPPVLRSSPRPPSSTSLPRPPDNCPGRIRQEGVGHVVAGDDVVAGTAGGVFDDRVHGDRQVVLGRCTAWRHPDRSKRRSEGGGQAESLLELRSRASQADGAELAVTQVDPAGEDLVAAIQRVPPPPSQRVSSSSSLVSHPYTVSPARVSVLTPYRCCSAWMSSSIMVSGERDSRSQPPVAAEGLQHRVARRVGVRHHRVGLDDRSPGPGRSCPPGWRRTDASGPARDPPRAASGRSRRLLAGNPQRSTR